MIKTKLPATMYAVRAAAVLGAAICSLAGAHAFSQAAKPKLSREAAAAASKAKPRSTYTGKAKLAQGFVVLPDGRKIAVPESVNSKLPGAGKMEGWPETTGQADEGMTEVAAVADEMIAEEVSKREQLARVNPGALKGNVIKPGPASKTHNKYARSKYTGQAKVKNGFVVLPDGRQFAVPAEVKATWPGMNKGADWPEGDQSDGQGDVMSEGGFEVQAANDEIFAETTGGKRGQIQANPAALKGKVVQSAPVQQPAQVPATSQPAKSKVAQ